MDQKIGFYVFDIFLYIQLLPIADMIEGDHLDDFFFIIGTIFE